MDSLALNKCLPLIFLPLGLSLLLLAAALRWRRWLLIAIPLVNLGLFGIPAIADVLMGSLEDRYPYRAIAECPQSDAGFVFGGMLGPRDHPDGGIAWNEAAERFDRALAIIKSGRARILVLSGGQERYKGGPDEGELLKDEAIARGVPDYAIVVTRATMNTEEEASALSRLIILKRWTRVLVVTSAFHMPRAMRLSKDCLADLVPVPVAYETPGLGSSWAYARPQFYLPQSEALVISERALREYFGILFYTAGKLI
jgi:uncharacterized SAM-binding protein YcdF (DUF218 family)